MALITALQAATQGWAEAMLEGTGADDGGEARTLLLKCQTHSLFGYLSVRSPDFVPQKFTTQASFEEHARAFVGAVSLEEMERHLTKGGAGQVAAQDAPAVRVGRDGTAMRFGPRVQFEDDEEEDGGSGDSHEIGMRDAASLNDAFSRKTLPDLHSREDLVRLGRLRRTLIGTTGAGVHSLPGKMLEGRRRIPPPLLRWPGIWCRTFRRAGAASRSR